MTNGETGRKLGILVGLECAEEVSSFSVVVVVSARSTLIIVVVAIFTSQVSRYLRKDWRFRLAIRWAANLKDVKQDV